MNFDFNVGMADLTEVRPRCSRSMDFVALHKKQLNHNESDKIVAQRTKERANLKRSIGAQVAQMMSWGDEILAHSSAPPSKKSCLKTRNDGKDEKQNQGKHTGVSFKDDDKSASSSSRENNEGTTGTPIKQPLNVDEKSENSCTPRTMFGRRGRPISRLKSAISCPAINRNANKASFAFNGGGLGFANITDQEIMEVKTDGTSHVAS